MECTYYAYYTYCLALLRRIARDNAIGVDRIIALVAPF